ncbi:MAG: DUF1592 domain-containing protein [Armatimonadetes bacterium]|nr:DUF1592 domain-containing protein [Armatimonadota bacterium]
MAVAMLAAITLFPADGARAQPNSKRLDDKGFGETVRPFVERYCSICHGISSPPGGFASEKFLTARSVREEREVWAKVLRAVETRHMPPPDREQPDDHERAAVVEWVKTYLEATISEEPGKVTLRRLNRAQYDNTIRDLVGTDLHLAADFPSDDVGYGFDNIGDVLSTSPLLLERWISAAEKVARFALPVLDPTTIERSSDDLKFGSQQGAPYEGDILLATTGDVWGEFKLDHGGDYSLEFVGYAQQAGPEIAQIQFVVDDRGFDRFDVKESNGKYGRYEINVSLPAGTHRIGVRFLNDYYDPGSGADRNLVVRSLTVRGPFGASDPATPFSQRMEVPQPQQRAAWKGAARESLKRFLPRVFRRPPSESEVDRYLELVQIAWTAGDSYRQGLQLALQASLASPSFLYRPEQSRGSGSRDLNSYELANRLSYFLWNSMPDDQLFMTAADGSIKKSEVLASQVDRMLKDAKSESLATDFGTQWLQLRRMQNFKPDSKLYPGYGDKVKAMAVEETQRFFSYVVSADRSILDFVSARYSFVNGTLANLYGISGVEGDEFQKVELKDPNRFGVITHSSVLATTSNPDRTSPTKRGKWILETIFGTPPPDPPPGVGTLEKANSAEKALTLKQRLEIHRKDPSCASCHQLMDPLGFGLENFGVTGKWRADDFGKKIDPIGEMADGSKFNGPAEMEKVLVKKKDLFVQNFARQLATYAIGRGLTLDDDLKVKSMLPKIQAQDHKFSSVVHQIVQSDIFRRTMNGD